MTSSNGNIFCVIGHLCREFIGSRWFPRTKASDAELWCFDLRLNRGLGKQSWGWWFETLSRPLWRHRNEDTKSYRANRGKTWRPELLAKSSSVSGTSDRAKSTVFPGFSLSASMPSRLLLAVYSALTPSKPSSLFCSDSNPFKSNLMASFGNTEPSPLRIIARVEKLVKHVV